ncbi:hypothetical protein F4861DRAFT_477153 [Xylaria intraflava]|nr:hypothetical protein F4861DRAFT_477153 [Xylaria intraflava]
MSGSSEVRLSLGAVVLVRLAISRMRARRSDRFGRWDDAFRHLDASDRAALGLTNTQHFDVREIIRSIENKKADCDRKKWTLFKRHDGTEVKVRDVLDKMVRWIRRFEKVGDVAAGFEPLHASLPWAGVKFLIEIVTHDFETCAKMADGLEIVSRVIVQVGEVEYIMAGAGRTQLKAQLSQLIVDIYVKVLRFLATARKFFDQSSSMRWVKGVFQSLQRAIKDLVDGISVKIEDVHRLSNEARWEDFSSKSAERYSETKSDLKALLELLRQSRRTSLEERARIRRWLNPTSSDNAQKQALGLRHETTCDWFLTHPNFTKWSQYNHKVAKILWIHAPAGFGKSVLCARVIDYMQSDSANYGQVLFFYCSGQHENKNHPFAILKSWIWQLVAKVDQNIDIIKDEDQAQQGITDGSIISESDEEYLWTLLSKLMVKDSHWTLVIDGYDECVDTTTNNISKYGDLRACRASFIHKLAETVRGTGIRVLLASRKQADIEAAIGDSSANPKTLEIIEHEVKKEDTAQDLSSYSQTIFDKKVGKTKKASNMADEAVGKSEGMFLWIALLDRNLPEGATIKQAKTLVNKTPSEIYSAYQAELDRILDPKNSNANRAIMILKWILYAARPLTIREMTEALAVTFNEDPEIYPRDDLPYEFEEEAVNEKYVQNCIRMPCGSFIELRKGDEDTSTDQRTIHFVHFSVKEFLQTRNTYTFQVSNPIFGLSAENTEHNWIATLCLQYMCYREFEDVSFPDKPNFFHTYPFFSYTAVNWQVHYARGREGNDNMSSETAKTAETVEPAWRLFSTTYWRLWAELLEQHLRQNSRDATGPLRGAGGVKRADSGYESMAITEPDSTTDESGDESESDISEDEKSGISAPTTRETISPSPVYYAAILGLNQIINQLANLNPGYCTLEGGRYGTPLQAAVVHRQLDAVEALLEHQADPSQICGEYGTPLIAAVLLGSTDILDKLIKAADGKLDATDNKGWTALYHACVFGSLDAVSRLVQAGANITLKPERKRKSMFMRAVMGGHLSVVEFLLKHDGEVNLVNETAGNEFTPLILAVLAGSEDMVRLLLQHGADLNIAGTMGLTALHLACSEGSASLAKLLVIEGKAKVECVDQDGETPLHFAARAKAKDVVEFLLEYGASPQRKAFNNGPTPYDLAMQVRSRDIVRLFTKRMPLKFDVPIEQLAFHDKDFDEDLYDSLTEIIYRSEPGPVFVRNILGLAMHVGSSPLFAWLVGYIRKEFIGSSEDIESSSNEMSNKLSFWSEMEAKLINDSSHAAWGTPAQRDMVLHPVWGSYPDAGQVLPDTMLPIAVTYRFVDVVSLLLQHGADIHLPVLYTRSWWLSLTSSEFNTPLQIAVRNHSVELVNIMLESGRITANHDEGMRGALRLAGYWGGMNREDLTRVLIAKGALDVDTGGKAEAGTKLQDEDYDSEINDDAPDARGTPLREPILDDSENRELAWWGNALVGEWKGSYSYYYRSRWSYSERTSFRIDSALRELRDVPNGIMKDVTLFNGGGKDSVANFLIHGQAQKGATFRFVKLYPEHGWMYEGSVEQTESGWSMEGKWGAEFGEAEGVKKLAT